METYKHTAEMKVQSLSSNVKNNGLSLQDNRLFCLQQKNLIQTIKASKKNILQCYTLSRFKGYKISESENFRTCCKNDENIIDKKDGVNTTIDEYLQRIKKIPFTNYSRYKFRVNDDGGNTNFVNDCGFFSLFLMSGDRKYLDFSRRKVNITDKERPDLGEGYFMRKTINDDNKCRHHAAAVIAKDGGDDITCEADVSKALVEPFFNMYGTEKPGQSFHDVNKSYFGDDDHPAKTQVLKPN